MDGLPESALALAAQQVCAVLLKLLPLLAMYLGLDLIFSLTLVELFKSRAVN